MKRISLTAAILLGSAALSTGAFAGGTYTATNPDSATFTVGLTIVDECTIATQNIDFGEAGIISTQLTAGGNITIECTHSTPYQVGLSGGASGDTDDRTMSAGDTDVIHYNLFSDSGYGSIWGEEQGVDTVDSASATGANEILPVYAKIDSHQNVAPGDYSDTITATIWYAGSVTGP